MALSSVSAGTPPRSVLVQTLTNPGIGTVQLLSNPNQQIGNLAPKRRVIQFQSTLTQPVEIQLLAIHDYTLSAIPFLDFTIAAGNVNVQDIIISSRGVCTGVNIVANEMVIAFTGSLSYLDRGFYILQMTATLLSAATGTLIYAYGMQT